MPEKPSCIVGLENSTKGRAAEKILKNAIQRTREVAAVNPPSEGYVKEWGEYWPVRLWFKQNWQEWLNFDLDFLDPARSND